MLAFEAALLSWMHSEHGDFMKRIDETGEYNEEVVGYLRTALEKFKETGAW